MTEPPEITEALASVIELAYRKLLDEWRARDARMAELVAKLNQLEDV